MEKYVVVTNEKVSNHIPDDLAFSILSKLPLKSLKRFGCVHKSWTLLFENPHFMSMYRNNFISTNHSYYNDTSILLQQIVPYVLSENYHSMLYLLSGERFENNVKLDWPPVFQEDEIGFYILGSCSVNGILCLHRRDTIIILWNPTTEEFKVIPPSPAESVPYEDVGANLLGFGYDHVRDDYKLIRKLTFFPITDRELDVPLEDISFHSPFWEIYSLRSNSWRKLDVDIDTCNGASKGVPLYMDGVCHWIDECVTHNDEAYLVSFELSNEMFFTTPIPLNMDDSFEFGLVLRHLILLNGSIALISNYEEMTTFHISILGELGVKESWTKLFIVGPLSCIEHPIGVGKKGNIFFRKKDDELAWFDLSTQMIEELGIKGQQFECNIVIYKESLLSIGGISN